MSAARRLSALAAAGALGLTVAASVVEAQTPTWSVTDISVAPATPDAVTVVSGTIEAPEWPGRITRVDVVMTRIEPSTGCAYEVEGTQAAYPDDDVADDESTETPTTDPEEPHRFDFDVPVDFGAAGVCNGSYSVDVIGTFDSDVDSDDNPDADDVTSDPVRHEEVGGEDVVSVVSAPAPPVSSAQAEITGSRTVAVSWQPPAGWGDAADCTATAPSDRPDFRGYVLERSAAGGPPEVLATFETTPASAVSMCYADELAVERPTGQYEYRVLTLRQGPEGAAVRSAAVGDAVTFAPGTPDTAAGGSTPVRPPSSSRIVSSGRSRPDGGATGATAAAPIDDGTFEQELDYGEPGEEAAVVPEDAESFLDFVPSPGPGILVPFAIAQCLAVWALHLRYLARRADDAFLTPERTFE